MVSNCLQGMDIPMHSNPLRRKENERMTITYSLVS